MVPGPARILHPAPLRPRSALGSSKPTFYDLPPELRIEIYSLALQEVTIHIVPPSGSYRSHPHPLACASKQVRHEVLPLMHSLCRIESTVTDFRFDGLLAWLSNIPPEEQHHLCKNERLHVRLCFTGKDPPRHVETLRRWLHDRADPCRPQPQWNYTGPMPNTKVSNDLRRRWRRMKEVRKRAVLKKMCKGIGVQVWGAGCVVGSSDASEVD